VRLLVPLAALSLAVPAVRAQLPAVVQTHCGECHTGADAERGYDLAQVFATADPAAAAAALVRLRSRTMPPPDAAEHPDDNERTALLLAFAARIPAEPGARIVPARKLSRRQFERTVQAVCGVTWDGTDRLPDDARSHGFDTLGGTAPLTPLWFEHYGTAAAAIADAMLADPAARARAFAADQPLSATLPAFLLRAFRRPATFDELAGRVALFHRLQAQGATAAAAESAVLQSILCSPAFLLRLEHGQPEAPHLLTAHELAVRLAYLLTGAPPDAELQAQAERGELLQPATLAAAARRLVAADDGRTLAEDFAGQWLRLRDVLTANADFRRYPEIWNHSLRPSFHEEAMQFVREVVRADRSVLTLLDADFTFVNDSLARHYGLPAVEGREFRRVALPDRRRGGLLGMGAVLMVTSHSLRTSPVLRGRWILDQLLDTPTPPPPPDAGTLPPDDVPVDTLSLRARLERHRHERRCAGCHAQLDPLGFALENFDVLGRWRTELHGQPIDARGELAGGAVLDGPIALKDELLRRRADFVRALAGKLMTYAIGRPMLPADEPELARIVAAVAAADHRFSSLLLAVVTSPLFVQRDPDGAMAVNGAAR
jgi:hypothetical protein